MQKSVLKIFDDTLVLDATENVCKFQNSKDESRTKVGKKGDFLTTEQIKCKILSKDELKKHCGKRSKKQPFFFESL